MENERKYIPINLDKLKDISDDINNLERREVSRGNPFIESFKTNYLDKEIFKYEGYSAYFLEKLDILKLGEIGGFDDGEDWKESQTIEHWNDLLEEKIKKNKDKPFEIKFPYSAEDRFEQLGLLRKGSYPKFFYIPDSMKGEIKRFNEHVENKIREESEEKIVNDIKNINLN